MKSLFPDRVRTTPAQDVQATVFAFVPLGVAPESIATVPKVEAASQNTPIPKESVALVEIAIEVLLPVRFGQ
jgi:hypothetical protein